MAEEQKKQGGFMNFLSSAGGGASIMGLSSLLGGLGGLIGGASESQKRSRTVFDLIKNRLGQSRFDPNQSLSSIILALEPENVRQNTIAGRRAGFDSGVVTGAGARGRQSTLAGILAKLKQFGAGLNAQTDTSLLSLLSDTARST